MDYLDFLNVAAFLQRETCSTRRGVLLASLLTASPLALSATSVLASPIDERYAAGEDLDVQE